MLKLVKALESIRQYTEKSPKTLREAKFMIDLIGMIANETLIEHAEDGMTAAQKTEMQKLVMAVQALNAKPSTRGEWDPNRFPALKVIDCVLSLNRPYDKFVVPRVDHFAEAYPEVRSVSDLQALILRFSSAGEFVREALNYKHEERAVTLSKVVDWLVTIAGTGDLRSQQGRLEAWAKDARFEEGNPGIRGFAIAGFQYMAMLFGANTAKPDVWIVQWVATQVDRKVSAPEALLLLETAARRAGVPVRDVDQTLWERATAKAA